MSKGLEWRRAVLDSSLDASAKHVALTLDVYMNRRGLAWPSRASLAADTSRGVKTIDRALTQLEHAGFVVVARTRGKRSNLYRAVIPNSVTSTTVEEVLTASLATPTGSKRTFNGGRDDALSRKKPLSKSREDDRSRDQNEPTADPASLELAYRWLATHTLPT